MPLQLPCAVHRSGQPRAETFTHEVDAADAPVEMSSNPEAEGLLIGLAGQRLVLEFTRHGGKAM